MQTKIIGGGTQNPGVELGIDPTFLAARVSTRPLDYAQYGQILGHYVVAVPTGAAVFAAGAILSNLRWTDASRYLVLNRLGISFTATAALTAGRLDVSASVARAYTVNDGTNATAVVLSGNNNKCRTIMGSSLVTNLGVVTATAAGQTGGTKTLDANAFAATTIPIPTTVVGTGLPYTVIYENDLNAQHPIVLAANEGIVVQNVTLFGGTGAGIFWLRYAWSEVVLF